MKKNLIFFLYFIAQNLLCQVNQKDFFEGNFNKYIESGMLDWKIPGLAVCVIKDGKVIKEECYGRISINDSTKINTNTVFMLGSVTKQFAAISLLKCLKDKGYDLDNKFSDILSNYNTLDTSKVNKLEIRKILSHQTGYTRGQDDFFKFDSDFSNKELIEKVYSLKPKNKINEFGYHNTGYVVTEEMIKTLTGLSWNTYLKQIILSPLNMDRSGTILGDFIKIQNKAKAHTIKDGKTIEIPYTDLKDRASGSLYSSINDMKKWLSMQLNYGSFQDKIVIDSSLIAETRTPQVTIFENANRTVKTSEYGLGWYINKYSKLKVIEHSGNLPGFSSITVLIPELKIGYVIVANVDDAKFPNILSYDLINYFSDYPFRNYNAIYKDYFKNNVKEEIKIKLTKNDLKFLKYNLGTYKNNVYGNLKLKEENDNITISFEHHPKVLGTVGYKLKNQYIFELNSEIFGKAFINFKKNKKGLLYLELSLQSTNEENHQTFIFKKEKK
ncbi:serine hydrolase domain-containing protein [Flavobacterium oreochromis]|uniref:Serine hydrolase domain-containing protein n=1 Tax=Flavobacterium oreochromis TaxID=2906078 RepID=A0ABW8PAC6_9FLAO|nr:serine hydrolase domain-containing protein [Flavobacterium oreochromis]OWP74141.1 hypothetical protein BWG23_14875 [Flavobacterium oreochromis]